MQKIDMHHSGHQLCQVNLCSMLHKCQNNAQLLSEIPLIRKTLYKELVFKNEKKNRKILEYYYT